MKNYFALSGLFLLLLGCSSNINIQNGRVIKPYSSNPLYWEYNNQPILLLGGTATDNLFQIDHLESHLDSLAEIGGNYVRNTMSDRDSGNHRAFGTTDNSKYDLDRWNLEYWERFERLLQLAYERDIIVQIEVWDRFDHSREPWQTNPYNPKNNVNYTYDETGLDSIYPEHPNNNLQPFFFTVPELDNNIKLLKFQEAFVKKMLSISLNYGNVLYCIDNETSGAEEWATYWARFISENSEGKEIYITQMWDSWNLTSDMHKRTLDHPDRFGFIDVSQNSHIPGRQNWDNAQYVFDYIKDPPRPVNTTKIYGSDENVAWAHRGMNTEHAIQTFFRNIIGGFASSRFHRPVGGLGLNQHAINSIRTVREIESIVKMWEIDPRMDLLIDNEGNTAYLSAREGEYYVIYFPKTGGAKLDLTPYENDFIIRWIAVGSTEWDEGTIIFGGKILELETFHENGSIALISWTN